MLKLNAKPEPVEINLSKSAVVVVDMQNAFASKNGMLDIAGVDISGASAVIGSIATRAAMTAHVGPSGPPMAKGSELRQAMIAPPTAPVMKVAAVP